MKYYLSVLNLFLILNVLLLKERKKEIVVGDVISVYVCEWGEVLWWLVGNISNVELLRFVFYLDVMIFLIRLVVFFMVIILLVLFCFIWMLNFFFRVIMIFIVFRELVLRLVNLELGVMEFLL